MNGQAFEQTLVDLYLCVTKIESILLCRVDLCFEGWLAYYVPSHWWTWLSGYTGLDAERCMKGLSEAYKSFTWFSLNQILFFCNLCLCWKRMWIYCLWLNLYAVNQLGIRCDCACLFRCCRLLIVLFEGRYFCFMNREKRAWNLWERESRGSLCLVYKVHEYTLVESDHTL